MKRNITALLTAMALLMSCSTLPVLAEEISDAPLTDEPLPATVAEPLPPMEEVFRQDGLIITIYTPYGYGTKYAAISGVEQNAESVTIPASFQDIPIRDIVTGALCSTSLKEILVAEDQQYYTSKDGVLFDAEGSTLKVYPLGKTGTYSVPEGTETIGTYAFSAPDDYKGLTEVTLPGSIRTIAPHAFLNQCGLTELVLPDGCKSVGEYAFAGCQGLTSLHLGKQLNSFFKSCTGCTSLQELTGDPYNFNIIDNVLFSKDNRLVLYPAGLTAEHYTMPDNVLGIREGAFENNPYLKEIDIPGTTVSVQETFCHMTALETLNFPEGVGSIGNVGVDCPALKSVSFPSTLAFVGASAFRDSKALTDIYYNGRAEQYEKISNVLTNRHIHCDRVTVHYNDEDEYELFFDGDEENGGFTYKLYEDHAVLAGFTRTRKTALNETVSPLAEVKGLPVTVVGRRAFENAVNYGGIELPDSIRIIEPYAFQSAMIQVNIPDGVEKIGECAFRMSHIQKAVIPASVKKIGKNAFSSSKITELEIAEGITTTGEGAFSDCTKLKTVHLPSTLESIGGAAFLNDTSLERIKVPYGVIWIGDRAFAQSGIRIIELPETVTEIGAQTFSRCENLRSITLPKSLKVLSQGVFEKSAITELTVPASVKTIESGALYECKDLKYVTILNPECDFFRERTVICTEVIYPETYDCPVPDVAAGYTADPVMTNDPVPDDQLHPTIVYDFTICGYKNSTAQQFANANNIPFEIYDPDAYEVRDVVSMQRFLLGSGASGGRREYDLNGDGVTDIYDLALLKRKLTLDKA